ncbi:hypothetical protein ACFX13_000815 [Malus domestica]
MLTGRIGKWIIALSEFSFQYVPQRAVKGQAIVDFLAEHQESQDEIINIPGTLEVTSVWIPPSKGVSGKEEWVQQEIKKWLVYRLLIGSYILMVPTLRRLQEQGL